MYVHQDGDVIFPSGIRIVRRPDPQDPGLGLVLLEDVLSFIAKQVAGGARPHDGIHPLLPQRAARVLCAGRFR